MKNFNLTKIINYLLIIFLFSLPWQTRYILLAGSLKGEYWEYSTLALYASDALLILIFILAIINNYLNKIKIKLSTSTIWLLILSSGLLLVNLYFSLNKIVTLWHIGWLVLAIGSFIILQKSDLQKSSAIIAFITGAALSALLGLWQFISQSSFASTILGLAKHNPNQLGVSVIEAIAPDGIVERWLRAYGSLDHPNMLGGLMFAGLIFSLFFIANNNYKNKKNIFIYASLIALIGGLITSFSRAGMLAIFVSVVIFMFHSLRQKQIKSKEVWLFFIINFFMIILLAIPYYYLFVPRFYANSRLEIISTEERFAGYKESWSIIKIHPIVGSGLGTFGLALEKVDPKQEIWQYLPVHNIFVLIFTETGLAGLVLLISAIYLLFKKTTTNNRILVISVLCGLFILGLLDHWLISLHFGLLMSAVVLGLALKPQALTDSN